MPFNRYSYNPARPARYVPGSGPQPCDLMLIGDSPNEEDNKHGKCFAGKSGKELDRYLWRSTGRSRDTVYVTNILKYMLPDRESDPTDQDLARDVPELDNEVHGCRPSIIGLLGSYTTRYFLGEADLDTIHGIPHYRAPYVMVPIVHPALGLHSTEFQAKIAWDFDQLGRVMRGEISHEEPQDEYPEPKYAQEFNREGVMVLDIAAVDTEGSVQKPWCLSWSKQPGQARVNRSGCPFTGRVIMHNAVHDLGVLRAMGVNIRDDQFDDTMIMAYNLCIEPQGLKALCKRHCGMDMLDYQDLTDQASRRHASQYIFKVLSWLNKRYSSASNESLKTLPLKTKRTSGRGGKKSLKTASRKK